MPFSVPREVALFIFLTVPWFQKRKEIRWIADDLPAEFRSTGASPILKVGATAVVNNRSRDQTASLVSTDSLPDFAGLSPEAMKHAIGRAQSTSKTLTRKIQKSSPEFKPAYSIVVPSDDSPGLQSSPDDNTLYAIGRAQGQGKGASQRLTSRGSSNRRAMKVGAKGGHKEVAGYMKPTASSQERKKHSAHSNRARTSANSTRSRRTPTEVTSPAISTVEGSTSQAKLGNEELEKSGLPTTTSQGTQPQANFIGTVNGSVMDLDEFGDQCEDLKTLSTPTKQQVASKRKCGHSPDKHVNLSEGTESAVASNAWCSNQTEEDPVEASERGSNDADREQTQLLNMSHLTFQTLDSTRISELSTSGQCDPSPLVPSVLISACVDINAAARQQRCLEGTLRRCTAMSHATKVLLEKAALLRITDFTAAGPLLPHLFMLAPLARSMFSPTAREDDDWLIRVRMDVATALASAEEANDWLHGRLARHRYMWERSQSHLVHWEQNFMDRECLASCTKPCYIPEHQQETNQWHTMIVNNVLHAGSTSPRSQQSPRNAFGNSPMDETASPKHANPSESVSKEPISKSVAPLGKQSWRDPLSLSLAAHHARSFREQAPMTTRHPAEPVSSSSSSDNAGRVGAGGITADMHWRHRRSGLATHQAKMYRHQPFTQQQHRLRSRRAALQRRWKVVGFTP